MDRQVTPGSDVSRWSGVETVAAVRAGRTSVADHLEALLERAGAARTLNAFITLDASGARARARELDERLAAGEAPPLAGLVVVVKDNIDVAGLPTTGGTPALQGRRARTHAPSVRRLVEAGAVVLGKTNLHELAFGITSTNLSSFAGPVRNPFGTDLVPGGSSGGTAVAVAVGAAPAGLGTDTGGSTRVPAALTGTVGFRPSVGDGGPERRYHDAGHVLPISRTRDTVGPIARTVADVALLDAVIAPAPAAPPVAIGSLRLGVPPTLWTGLDPELDTVLRRRLDELADAGVTLVEADLPGLFDLNDQVSFAVALHEPRTDIPDYLAATGVDATTLDDIVRAIGSPDVAEVFRAVTADAMGPFYDDAVRVHRPALQRLYRDHFAAHALDAVLFPTTVLPAFPMDLESGSSSIRVGDAAPTGTFGTVIRNTDPASNAGIPGLSLPAGTTAAGLPVGLEIDGPLGGDRRLLAVGEVLESVLGPGPTPPSAGS
ncbi:indoleacetamide hydrolase [Actinomycetospora soli]|uniref:indoleacetamide hydrolase n=1 Tax=Actinomycetospora soli TaxID=2893887 RepID=UPI001E5DFC60|nr:indoleacetamide hydrolase [Actinomycetospora soli]MCD2188373.1 indoleacetamide hydrolase [Actinomycetospora soli]